jgi:hypothetical protein
MTQVEEQLPEVVQQQGKYILPLSFVILVFLELAEHATSVEALRSAIETLGNAMNELCKY